MKHRLQTLLKHKLQWMFLFAALLGVNQGVWSAYSGTTVYLDLSGFTGWGNNSATFALQTYTDADCKEGGSDETAFSSVSGCTNLYSATITNGGNINGIKVLRKSGTTTWNSASVNVSSGGYNCIRVTGWDSASYDITISISPFSVYFDNTNTNWNKVYICLRSSSYWETNGTGGQNNTYFGEMSQVGQSKIYTATNSCGSSVVAFCEDNQYNYQYFHNTDAAYSDGSQFNVTGSLSSSTPLFTPSSNSEVKNSTNYYSGAWSPYSSCTAPQASDITISKPSSATTIYTTTNSSGDPETSSQELSASCDKGDTYQWSVSPATITSNHAGGDGKSYERAVFTDGSQKSGSVKFIYEGVYKVKFSAGCSTTSVDKEETINTITVKPGKLYLSGPLINEDGADNFNTSYEMTRNDNTYTYTWTVANASSATKGDKNDFQIKKTTRNAADEATRKQLIPTYSTLTLQDNTVTKATSGNRDLYANISYSAGDQLKCTVTYAGPDNNGVPQYTVKLEKVCSAPTLSNFTITGSLEQTLSGLTAISASSNTQGYNPSIEVQYNGSSSLPIATGAYPVTLVVGANGDYCASTVAVGTLNVYEVIVKAKKANITGWTDMYLHHWDNSCATDWSAGKKMNYDGSEWYTLGLNCTPGKILFKDAAGDPSKQTVDVGNFSGSNCYEVLNEMDNNKYKVKVYENCQLCTDPTVVTNNTPENVTETTATLKCTVTEAGDCQDPEIGIAYGTSEHPTSGTEGTVSGGVCSVNLTNLVAGKYYYYRAYTTVGGTTTYGEEYGFYTKPANIYIKGLIIHSGNGCPNPWPTDNTAFSNNADGTVFTKTITARKPNCSYDNVNSDAEFVLMSSTEEADKLNVKGTFNPDGQNSNWIRSKRSGDHDEKYNFKYSAEYNAGDQLTITVTFMSDGTFKMKVSPACDTEVQKKNISIASSAICSGSSVNVTVASSQSGVTYTVYDAANNEVGTGTGTGGDLNISVSPSASTTFTVKGSQGAACESTTMNNTVDVTVWNAPKYSPTSNITAYLPITITGTTGSSWSITSPSPAVNAWLSNTSGLTTVFKAPAGTYTVQDSNTSCATNFVTITVAADSETCQ